MSDLFDLQWARGKFPELKATEDRLQAARASLATIFTEAGPEMDPAKVKAVAVKDGQDLRDTVIARNKELEELKDAVDGHVEVARAAYNALHGGLPGSAEPGDANKPGLLNGPVGSIGDMFAASEAFKGYAMGSGSGPLATLNVSLMEALRPRATLFQTTGGWEPENVRTGRVEMFPTRPAPHVIDAIPQTETSQAKIPYMEETTFTNNAAEAAEGATYGEAALVLTEKDSTVRKIAVWIPVTDEQFEDEPRARGYVNNRLPFMLYQRLDSQALVGNGTAPNLRGTENVTGIQTQALGSLPIFDAVYKMFRAIRDDGFAEPSVFFVRPSKWETVRLTRTADGVYILGNPGDVAPVRLWGVPGIETTAVTSTKIVAGDYQNFAELAVRRGIDIQVSNAHSDYFINGKLAIRADVRVALVHYRPKAFGEVTGL